METTKEELYRARMDFETMKKQAENTNVEYDRILEQYSKLEVSVCSLSPVAYRRIIDRLHLISELWGK